MAGGLVFPSLNDESTDQSNDISDGVALVSVVLSVGLSVLITQGTKNSEEEIVEEQVLFMQRFKANPKAMKRDLKRLSGPQYKWLVSISLQVDTAKQKQFWCALNKNKKELDLLVDQASDLEQMKDEKIEILYWFFIQKLQELEENKTEDFCKKAE